MKQIFIIITCFVLGFCLVACNSQLNNQNTDSMSVSSVESLLETENVSESLNDDLSESSIINNERKIEKIESTAELTPVTSDSVESILFSSASEMDSSDAASKAISETSSDSDVVSSVPPPQAFSGQTIEELVQWLQDSTSTTLPDNKPYSLSSNGTRKLVVPRIVNEELSSYGITVAENSNTYTYLFRTYKSESDSKDEIYSIGITPLTEENAQGNLVELYDAEGAISTATYKNITYAYINGYEGTGQTDCIFATAWFVKDGYSIKITVSWANSFKPWNTDYFDYFDFETITF